MSLFLDKPFFDTLPAEEFISRKIVGCGLSLRDIEKRSGIPKSRIGLLKNQQAKLTVEDVMRLGYSLGFDPTDALRGAPQIQTTSTDAQKHVTKIVSNIMEASLAMMRAMGHKLDIGDLIAWHRTSGGRLEAYEIFKPFVGLFSVSDGDTPQIEAREIGPKSLAASSLQTPDADQVNSYIRSLQRASREQITFTYLETQERAKWHLYDREVTVDFPGAGPRYLLSYATLLLPVTAANGERFLMNFSTYLGSEVTNSSGASA